MTNEEYMRISRIVGWTKTREIPYPTRERVFAETNLVTLLEWNRFLDDPKTDEEEDAISAVRVRVLELVGDLQNGDQKR